MSERTKPNPKAAYYRRKRKYGTLPDGTRTAEYVAYLGRADSMNMQALQKEWHAINQEHKEWLREHPFESNAPIRKKSVEISYKIEMLEIALVEKEKGVRLTKLEKEILLNTPAETYKDVEVFMTKWIDDRYLPDNWGITYGIHKITNDLNDTGVKVSTTAVQNYIKKKGIWEKREFGRPKKIDVDVEVFIKRTEELIQQIEILEDSYLRGISGQEKLKEMKYIEKRQEERRKEYGAIPLKEF